MRPFREGQELPPFVDEGLARQIDFALRPSQFLIRYAAFAATSYVYGRSNRNSENCRFFPVFPHWGDTQQGKRLHLDRLVAAQSRVFRRKSAKTAAPAKHDHAAKTAARAGLGELINAHAVRPEWLHPSRVHGTIESIRPTCADRGLDRTSPGLDRLEAEFQSARSGVVG